MQIAGCKRYQGMLCEFNFAQFLRDMMLKVKLESAVAFRKSLQKSHDHLKTVPHNQEVLYLTKCISLVGLEHLFTQLQAYRNPTSRLLLRKRVYQIVCPQPTFGIVKAAHSKCILAIFLRRHLTREKNTTGRKLARTKLCRQSTVQNDAI